MSAFQLIKARALGRAARGSLVFVVTLFAVEFLDELVYGVQGAALPLIRDELSLSYEQIGLLLGLPIVLANLVEPLMGLLADTGRRRASGRKRSTPRAGAVHWSPGRMILRTRDVVALLGRGAAPALATPADAGQAHST